MRKFASSQDCRETPPVNLASLSRLFASSQDSTETLADILANERGASSQLCPPESPGSLANAMVIWIMSRTLIRIRILIEIRARARLSARIMNWIVIGIKIRIRGWIRLGIRITMGIKIGTKIMIMIKFRAAASVRVRIPGRLRIGTRTRAMTMAVVMTMIRMRASAESGIKTRTRARTNITLNIKIGLKALWGMHSALHARRPDPCRCLPCFVLYATQHRYPHVGMDVCQLLTDPVALTYNAALLMHNISTLNV